MGLSSSGLEEDADDAVISSMFYPAEWIWYSSEKNEGFAP
jgi:hypothetical protein